MPQVGAAPPTRRAVAASYPSDARWRTPGRNNRCNTRPEHVLVRRAAPLPPSLRLARVVITSSPFVRHHLLIFSAARPLLSFPRSHAALHSPPGGGRCPSPSSGGRLGEESP